MHFPHYFSRLSCRPRDRNTQYANTRQGKAVFRLTTLVRAHITTIYLPPNPYSREWPDPGPYLNGGLWIRPGSLIDGRVHGSTKLQVPASGTRITTINCVGSGIGAVMPPYYRLRGAQTKEDKLRTYSPAQIRVKWLHMCNCSVPKLEVRCPLESKPQILSYHIWDDLLPS